MLKIALIRHFATDGNLHKRYIGSTDEALCEEGKLIAQSIQYPEIEALFVSPLLRCVETAKIIYPSHMAVVLHEFRECDFGEFENKNYKELSNNPNYQDWIDSDGTLPFPGGEDIMHFKERCVMAFHDMIDICLERAYESIGVIAHGGTIMSILDQYSEPHEGYFHWQVGNGMGYIAEMKEDDRRLSNICTIH